MAAISCRTRRHLKRSGGPSGNFGDRLDQLRPFEQTNGPRRRRPALVAGSSARMRRARAGLARGARPRLCARRGRRRPKIPGYAHRPAPAASRGGRRAARSSWSTRSARSRSGSPSRACSSVFLRGGERLGGETGEAHKVDAIAGVELVFAGRVEAFAKQPRDRRGVVERPAGAHGDAAHRAVDAKEARLRAGARPWPDARAGSRDSRASRAIVPSTSSRREIGLAKRRSAEKSGAAKRGEMAPRSRPQSASRRLITSAPKRAAIGARGRKRDIADAAQAGAGQIGDGLFRQGRGRRAAESWKILANGRSDRPVGAMRRSENRASAQAARGASASAQSDVETLGGEARFDLARHFRLVAEQMRDAGNVEHQPVRAIERDKRGEARAPVGEAAPAAAPLPPARLRRR